MNKKGQQMFDAGDLIFSVVLFAIVLFLMSFYVSMQREEVKKLAEEKITAIDQDRFVIDYLQTPISDTTYIKKESFDSESKKQIEFMIKQNMTIADLFVLIANEPETPQRKAILDLYPVGLGGVRTLDILRRITTMEPTFANKNIILIYPSGKEDIVNSAQCVVGIPTKAYIPMENGKNVGIRVILC